MALSAFCASRSSSASRSSAGPWGLQLVGGLPRWADTACSACNMARPGNVDALGRRLPARHVQQQLPQPVQTFPVRAERCTAGAQGGLGPPHRRAVQLVPDIDHRNVLGSFALRRFDICVSSYIFRSILPRQVVQEQHGVRPGDLVPGAGDADAPDLVAAVAQAGGVDDVQRHASIWMVCCTLSRVVPAIGVTMASSAPPAH